MKYNWKSVKLDDATFQKLFESKQNYHILLHFFFKYSPQTTTGMLAVGKIS